MNKVLKPFREIFFVIYSDDIVIRSLSKVDHEEQLRKVLEVLQDNKLFIDLKNYSFMTNRVMFLCYLNTH